MRFDAGVVHGIVKRRTLREHGTAEHAQIADGSGCDNFLHVSRSYPEQRIILIERQWNKCRARGDHFQPEPSRKIAGETGGTHFRDGRPSRRHVERRCTDLGVTRMHMAMAITVGDRTGPCTGQKFPAVSCVLIDQHLYDLRWRTGHKKAGRGFSRSRQCRGNSPGR